MAASAQADAYRCGIGPNGNENGAYLRNYPLRRGTDAFNRLPRRLQQRAYHPEIHTDTYFLNVAGLMGEAVQRDGTCNRRLAIAILQEIRTQLYENRFPYRNPS